MEENKDKFQVTTRYGRGYKSHVEIFHNAWDVVEEIRNILSVGQATSFSVRDLSPRKVKPNG